MVAIDSQPSLLAFLGLRSARSTSRKGGNEMKDALEANSLTDQGAF